MSNQTDGLQKRCLLAKLEVAWTEGTENQCGLLLLTLKAPDRYMYVTLIMDDYFAAVSNALFVFHYMASHLICGHANGNKWFITLAATFDPPTHHGTNTWLLF